VIACFVDIGGINDHHCLEVVVCFVDIGGIVDHHCLKVVVYILLILVELLTFTV
jgi:hypothetical protein